MPGPADAPSHSTLDDAHVSKGSIYVGGLDRSGKTTMSAFLTSHSQIAIPAVGSNMWSYFYLQYGNLAKPENLERCLQAMLCYKHVKFLQPDAARIREEFSQGPPTYARLFEIFLIHFAEREGKPRWGAQTGLIERYVPQLIDSYEDVRIIHMLRDPRDRYLASLELWPEGRGRAGGASARWLYSTRLAERHAQRYPAQFTVVRFEDLITDTEATMRRCCSFVGATFEPAMLEMAGAPRLRDRLTTTASQEDESAMLSADHIGRFRGRVPSAEVAFIQGRAGRCMARHGYECEDVDAGFWGPLRFVFLDWPSQMVRLVAWRTVEALQQRFPRLVRRKPGRRMIVEPG